MICVNDYKIQLLFSSIIKGQIFKKTFDSEFLVNLSPSSLNNLHSF